MDGGFGQKIAGFYGRYDLKVMNCGLKKDFFDNYDVKKVMSENRLVPELIVEDLERMEIGS